MYSNHCMGNSSLEILHNTYESAPLTVISSLLSIFGSSLIIVSYLLWRDVRKSTARAILLFLAIADFLTAAGYLWSAIVYLHMFSSVYHKDVLNFNTTLNNFHWACKIESFWDTYFPLVSFFWTAHLAIYFVVTLVFLKPELAKKLMIPFHLTAWFIPLIICVTGVLTNWLGPNAVNTTEDVTAGAWCFVSSESVVNITNNSQQKIDLYYGMEVVFGKGIEMSVYLVVIVCYVLILFFNRAASRISSPTSQEMYPQTTIAVRAKQRLNKVLANTDLKLLLVPILFILVRSGGTLRFLISALYKGCRIPVYNQLKDGICINQTCFNVLYSSALLDFQAFCDPFQGFVNGVIFVFLSKSISSKLLDCIGIPIKLLITLLSYPISWVCCLKRSSAPSSASTSLIINSSQMDDPISREVSEPRVIRQFTRSAACRSYGTTETRNSYLGKSL